MLNDHGWSVRDLLPPHNGVDTSIEAAESVTEAAPVNRVRVYEYLKRNGGATCDEVELALGLSHQTASSRLWELEKMGRAEKTEARRTTRSGRKARVYRALEVR